MRNRFTSICSVTWLPKLWPYDFRSLPRFLSFKVIDRYNPIYWDHDPATWPYLIFCALLLSDPCHSNLQMPLFYLMQSPFHSTIWQIWTMLSLVIRVCLVVLTVHCHPNCHSHVSNEATQHFIMGKWWCRVFVHSVQLVSNSHGRIDFQKHVLNGSSLPYIYLNWTKMLKSMHSKDCQTTTARPKWLESSSVRINQGVHQFLWTIANVFMLKSKTFRPTYVCCV